MESNVYNLTNPQKSIWFTEQFYKGTPIENITGCVIVLEKLNLKALQKAINLFVKSNDSFRLKFTVKDDKPLQYLSSSYFSPDKKKDRLKIVTIYLIFFYLFVFYSLKYLCQLLF